jgi:hypothetical protein
VLHTHLQQKFIILCIIMMGGGDCSCYLRRSLAVGSLKKSKKLVTGGQHTDSYSFSFSTIRKWNQDPFLESDALVLMLYVVNHFKFYAPSMSSSGHFRFYDSVTTWYFWSLIGNLFLFYVVVQISSLLFVCIYFGYFVT